MNKPQLTLLGFAFASSDVSLELAPDGSIAVAVGATSMLGGSANLEGSQWRSLVAAADQPMMAAALDRLPEGERVGPLAVRLAATGRAASISFCRLPELRPNISCSISARRSASTLRAGKQEHGLHDLRSFASVSEALLGAARDEGIDLDVALIELIGFEDLGRAGKKDAQAALAAAVRAEAVEGTAATLIGGDRFAVVRQKPSGPDKIEQRLAVAAEEAGITGARVQNLLVEERAPAGEALRALRWALNTFVGSESGGQANLAAEFRQKIAAATAQASAFKEMVRGRSFSLVYQPIVSLKDRSIHHFEALSRFPDRADTYETVRMAEELEIIDYLDQAVAEEAIKALRLDTTGGTRVAINLSAHSLLQPDFVETVLGHLQGAGRLGHRLLFEVTESATLKDLDAAEERIQILRRHGHKVWLDDFGAGSASLGYLQALTVDGVKIDGKYIRDLASGRNAALVRHISGLCKELGIVTVAEMVETSSTHDTLCKLGIDFGQGWFYGRPQANLSIGALKRELSLT